MWFIGLAVWLGGILGLAFYLIDLWADGELEF